MRAELFLGRPLVACLHTAARLHGFGVVPDSDLHLTTSEARSLHPPAGVVIHQRMLRSPAARMNGILATSPADTAIDVAAIVREIDVLAVLDSAVRAGVAQGSLQDALLRAARRRGIVQVRDQLPLVSAAAESAMESRTRFRLHEAGLPRPELQIPIRTRSGVRRLDMGWRAARVGLEFDGQDFHSGDGSLDRDRERGRELLEAGWSVLHVTGRDVYLHPERFTGALRVLLRDRT